MCVWIHVLEWGLGTCVKWICCRGFAAVEFDGFYLSPWRDWPEAQSDKWPCPLCSSHVRSSASQNLKWHSWISTWMLSLLNSIFLLSLGTMDLPAPAQVEPLLHWPLSSPPFSTSLIYPSFFTPHYPYYPPHLWPWFTTKPFRHHGRGERAQ